MIGDDQIQIDLAGVVSFIRRADSTVHRQRQAYAARLQAAEGISVQAVALVKPIWYVGLYTGAESPKHLHQQRGGRHAVHVIVAIDGDRFLVVHRKADSIKCGRHAREAVGIRVEICLGLEETPGVCICRIAAIEQDLPQDRMKC